MSLYLGTTPIADSASNALLAGKANVNLSNASNTGIAAIAYYGMPSSTLENLTLGASGSTYTAPANGFLFLSKEATVAGQFIQFSDGVSYPKVYSSGATTVSLLYPCRKGVAITINYSADGSTNAFRFIYAEGSKWEA